MGCCTAIGCRNHSRNKIRLFRFPKDQERRKKWIENCGLNPHTLAKVPYLCIAHFDENQFEQHRQDNYKKLKCNAIPTLFFEPDPPKRKKKETPIKIRLKKSLKVKISRKSSKKDKKGNQGSSDNSQKENSFPRKSKKREKEFLTLDSGSEGKTFSDIEDLDYEMKDVDEDEDEDEAAADAKQDEIYKAEIEELKIERGKFEKHNMTMSNVILELEKHNNLLGIKLVELEKENKVVTYKIQDLEKLNEELKSKLNTTISDEQRARMEKMRQLGTIERYIPGIND